MAAQGGKMNRLITIERPVKTQDPTFGTDLITYVPLESEPGSPTVAVKFWAEVQDVPPSRSEAVAQGLEVARNQTRIRMRWRGDVTPDCRVKIHGVESAYDQLCSIIGGPAEFGGRLNMIEFVVERYTS